MKVTDAMVDRFLGWPLPKSVCADLCATDPYYQHQRYGTSLLNVHEARAMLEYVLACQHKGRRYTTADDPLVNGAQPVRCQDCGEIVPTANPGASNATKG